jgi:hypothetical protein
MLTGFPQAVPEIPVRNVEHAAAYYVRVLGFSFDWGNGAGGIGGISVNSKHQVEELFERWKSAGAKIIEDVEDKLWNLPELHRDPARQSHDGCTTPQGARDPLSAKQRRELVQTVFSPTFGAAGSMRWGAAGRRAGGGDYGSTAPDAAAAGVATVRRCSCSCSSGTCSSVPPSCRWCQSTDTVGTRATVPLTADAPRHSTQRRQSPLRIHDPAAPERRVPVTRYRSRISLLAG